jgi:hypothetical protein
VLSDGTTSPSLAEILVIRDDTLPTYRITGKMFDAFTGGPLEYVTVKIGDISSSITDRNGMFFVAVLLPGTYKLNVSKFGYESLSASFQVIASGPKDFRTIPASLTYPLLHDMKTGYGSIAGRYLDPITGAGITNKYIYLYNWIESTQSKTVPEGDKLVTYTATQWQYEDGVVLTSKTSLKGEDDIPDIEGSFKLTHLEPGYYAVCITSDNEPPKLNTKTIGKFDWLLIATGSSDITEIRGLKVEAGKTTYWTNYEQEYK